MLNTPSVNSSPSTGYVNSQIDHELLIGQTRYILDQNVFNVRRLTDSMIKRLYASKLIHHPHDVFRLSVTDFSQIGVKEQTAIKIRENLDQASHIPLTKFIMSFGIHGIGLRASEKIAEHFTTAKGLIDALIVISENKGDTLDFKKIPMLDQLIHFSLNNKERLKRMRTLIKQGVLTIKPHTPTFNLSRYRFAIAGTLPIKRSTLVEQITKLGGCVDIRVSAKTNAVIASADTTCENSVTLMRAKQRNLLVIELDPALKEHEVIPHLTTLLSKKESQNV